MPGNPRVFGVTEPASHTARPIGHSRDTEYQAPIAVTIIFIDTVAFDEERTRNDCVTVVDGVESVTGDTQHVADAFATAALHAGGEEKTPDGNLVDPTLAKKMSVV